MGFKRKKEIALSIYIYIYIYMGGCIGYMRPATGYVRIWE